MPGAATVRRRADKVNHMTRRQVEKHRAGQGKSCQKNFKNTLTLGVHIRQIV